MTYFDRIVGLVIKARHLTNSQDIPLGIFLDIGTLHIPPGAKMAAILQNGRDRVLLP